MQLNNIFDSHAHYDDRRFDSDRDEVLAGLTGAGVSHVMNAACDIASCASGIAMAEQYDFVYTSAGVHPHDAKSATDDLEAQLTGFLSHPKCLAVGEMGLDYHYDFSPRETQCAVFERQLVLAKTLDMPVIIHDREAHGDMMAMLKKHPVRGVIHCYSGSAQMAQDLLGMGFYIGFTGVVTFNNARKVKEAAAAVPLDRLLVETDCPYMAPVPHRGERCDSSMIAEIAKVLAELKGVSPQELLDITCANAKRLYGIA